MTSRFSSVSSIKVLRARIRRERRALSRQEQLAHAEAVAHHLAKSSYFRRAKVIAVYLDTDGELMTAPLIREARRAHKTILLPVLHPFRQGRLIFREWQEKALLELNRFHILEPTRHARRVELRRIDLVITPLVAIDMHAMRIGMGGGYYDRTFAFRQRFHWRKPLLVGVAHSLQIVTTLPQKKYDVLLDAFVSEKGMQRAFHKKK